ncbi:MAG: sigma-54-dependent Fis family transcriptional regulator, partial [bacterium]|nr:sigma-54-dependent Fis family transcriptional regulator [bacterium]
GSSPPIQKLMEMIELVAKREATVLIEGESGTGKELVARALHASSQRAEGPFIPVNSGVIPENLFESAAFGHEKGSFSGADSRHIGYFERASGGTIFIDDVDDFPYQLQVKLLRVLQERELERVGGTEPIPVDVRVVAASKVNLWAMVQQERFREDLYFRLNIVPIHVPALRERKDDIPLLVEHFLEKHQAEAKAKARLSELLGELMDYDWPGNVRQLENIVLRIIALPETEQLGLSGTKGTSATVPADTGAQAATPYPAYTDFIEQKDREIILWALEETRFNTSTASKILEIPRSTLRSKMEKYGIGQREQQANRPRGGR